MALYTVRGSLVNTLLVVPPDAVRKVTVTASTVDVGMAGDTRVAPVEGRAMLVGVAVTEIDMGIDKFDLA